MNFFIEIIIFEYPEETEIYNYENQQFTIPSNDPLTSELEHLVGPIYNKFNKRSYTKDELVNRSKFKKLKNIK